MNSSTVSIAPTRANAEREAFVEELLAAVAVYPLTTDIARLAAKLDAQQQSLGTVIPFADLLIGAAF